MQRPHQRLAPQQHRAHVDVPLVGDFPRIDTRWLFQRQRTRRKGGTAAAFGLDHAHALFDGGAHLGVRQHLVQRRIRRQLGAAGARAISMPTKKSLPCKAGGGGASANAGQKKALSVSNREDQGQAPVSALPGRALSDLTPIPRHLTIAHCRLDWCQTTASSAVATQSSRARYFRSHR